VRLWGLRDSIPIACRVIFRADYQSPALFSSTIDGLYNVNEFLLVLQHPIQLVVVPSSKIAHHMLVPKEKHNRYRVVQFIHLLEVGDLVEIAHIDDGKVLDSIGDAIQDLVLSHALRVPVTTEADDHQSFLLAHDSLIDMPARDEMGEDDGTHCELWTSMRLLKR